MREGPAITRSCLGCKWLKSEFFRVQGDSGRDYNCTYYGGIRFIASYYATTPDWCPVPVPREAHEKEVQSCICTYIGDGEVLRNSKCKAHQTGGACND